MALIEMTKQYRTREGRPARVLCVDRKSKDSRPVCAVFEGIAGEEHCYYLRSDGFVSVGVTTGLDLIEVTPYDGLKVDDLVMVRDDDGQDWIPYRFAGVNKAGLPMTWHYGCCSFTATKIGGSVAIYWNQCRLATPQEIEAARKYNMENAK